VREHEDYDPERNPFENIKDSEDIDKKPHNEK